MVVSSGRSDTSPLSPQVGSTSVGHTRAMGTPMPLLEYPTRPNGGASDWMYATWPFDSTHSRSGRAIHACSTVPERSTSNSSVDHRHGDDLASARKSVTAG